MAATFDFTSFFTLAFLRSAPFFIAWLLLYSYTHTVYHGLCLLSTCLLIKHMWLYLNITFWGQGLCNEVALLTRLASYTATTISFCGLVLETVDILCIPLPNDKKTNLAI